AFVATSVARRRRHGRLVLGGSIDQPGSVRRLLYGLHSVSGILMGTLALVVFYSGALSVFADELGAWARRGRVFSTLEDLPEPNVTALVDQLAAATDARFRDDISLFQSRGGPLTLFLHLHTTEHGESLQRGVRYDVDPATHEILLRR